MRTSAAFVALLTMLVGSAWPGSVQAGKKNKPTASLDAAGCGKLTQNADVEGRGLVFELQNRCPDAVTCDIKWETRCDKNEPVKHEDSASLDGNATQTFNAASGCSTEQAWRVSAATWSCRPRPTGTASR